MLELRDIFGTSDPVCENKVTERVELRKFEHFPRFQNLKIMKSNKIFYLILLCKKCNDFYMNLFFNRIQNILRGFFDFINCLEIHLLNNMNNKYCNSKNKKNKHNNLDNNCLVPVISFSSSLLNISNVAKMMPS